MCVRATAFGNVSATREEAILEIRAHIRKERRKLHRG
jgi:hypothetical protein